MHIYIYIDIRYTIHFIHFMGMFDGVKMNKQKDDPINAMSGNVSRWMTMQGLDNIFY